MMCSGREFQISAAQRKKLGYRRWTV